MPDGPVTQTVVEPIPQDPIVVTAGGLMVDAGTPTERTTDGSEDSAGRPRDGQGRYVSSEEAAVSPELESTPTEPRPPKFGPQMMDLARSVQFSDAQIDAFDDPSILWDAIQGRQAHAALLSAQQVSTLKAEESANLQPSNLQPATSGPTVEPVLEDFTLQLDDDAVAPELAKPVKELATYVNMLKASLGKRVEQLSAQNVQLQSELRQSVAVQQTANTQQYAGYWDQIAGAIPGMVEAIGKPSEAMRSPGSPNAIAWDEVARNISLRVELQNVPDHLANNPQATQEAWTVYQAVKGNRNGKPSGDPKPLPGVAVRAASRATMTPPTDRGNLTQVGNYDERLANMEAMWQEAGGNPFV